ncbi:MAG: ABC transporter ATP-binding protein [Prevotella sp.]|nr:ABC transporter ATP-binding protein [Prevotella sp.]
MDGETIKLRGLCIGYHTKHGVRQVAGPIDGAIRSGELTCLLGANGVGKSTLLRTLAAFQPKVEGDIFFAEEREISDYTDKELSRLIGVVLTEKPDVRNMSVRELVSLGRSPYTGFWGTYSKEDLQVVDEAIALVGIESLSSRMIHTLSDGERQKVMIAKALAQQTPVIYLDEPTAFLDYPSKVEVLQLLRRISREAGKTIFLSTHDVELALQLADTIWLMTRETGVSIGSPQALAQQGILGSFIEREDIAFDPETLAIKILRNN